MLCSSCMHTKETMCLVWLGTSTGLTVCDDIVPPWTLSPSCVHIEETMCLVWLRVTILCFHFIITASVLPTAFWHLLCCEESEVILMALLQLIWVSPNMFLCFDP